MRKKIGPISQKVREIVRFENFKDLRFRLDLTHKNYEILKFGIIYLQKLLQLA